MTKMQVIERLTLWSWEQVIPAQDFVAARQILIRADFSTYVKEGEYCPNSLLGR